MTQPPNTSATGGVLLPAPVFVLGPAGPGQGGLGAGFLGSSGNLNDADFHLFLAVLVAGITALPQDLVRPRWQPEPPTEPDITVDWCAIGEVGADSDTFDWEGEQAGNAGDGFAAQYLNEEVDIMASFYGPNAGAYARALRDGIRIPQNREPLTAAGMGLIACGRVTRAPEFIKQKWYNRYDLPFSLRRSVTHEVPVLTITSASGEIATDAPTTVTPFTAQATT